MKKKIISLYSFFFVLMFVILFLSDFFYKKYVINLKMINLYKVSAIQSFNLKENSLNSLLDDIFDVNQNLTKSERKKIYKFQEYEVNRSINSYTLSNALSLIKFDLITKDNFDPKQLEKKLNEYYISSVNKIIKDIEKNLPLFDYNYISKKYSLMAEAIINEKYDLLVNSEFYQKYPPSKCEGTKEHCLKVFVNYYDYILEQINLDNKNANLINFLNTNKENEPISIFDTVQDFYLNKYLFDVGSLFDDYTIDEIPAEKKIFLSKKFDRLIDSRFFAYYIDAPENQCRTYRVGCLQDLSDYFNTLLYKHKLEKENFFRVKYEQPEIKEYSISKEVPKILGLSALFTYILFILTIKFFKRKIK